MQVRGLEPLRVLESLEKAPQLVTNLVEELRIPEREVLSILEQLRRKGVVERAQSGFYYLKKR